LAAQALEKFKQEQTAREFATQALEHFKTEQARKAQERQQEIKLSLASKEPKPGRER